YDGLVRMQVRRLFGIAALAVCLGAPLVEMFDRWDRTLQDGNDTEANLVVAVLCVGAGFVVARTLVQRIRPALTRAAVVFSRPSHDHHATPSNVLPFFDASSPPVALRI